ncbi:MAG: O-antigen ligase family protein [Ignavibacteriales bacterium]|nr:O-antigen ligase family protein [Ignavibacteriales bacterium]
MGIIILSPFKYDMNYHFNFSNWSHVTLGRFFSFTALIILFFTIKYRKNGSMYLWFFLLLSIVSLYLTGLRAGILGLIILLPLLLWLEARNKTITYRAMIFFFIVIAIWNVACALQFSGKNSRRASIATIVQSPEKTNDDAVNVRWEIYALSLEMIKEKPILGWGIGGFRNPDKGYLAMFNKYPHNLFLEVGVEFGVFGLILLIYLLSTIIRTLLKHEPIWLSIFLLALWLSMFSKDITTNAVIWMFLSFPALSAATRSTSELQSVPD